MRLSKANKFRSAPLRSSNVTTLRSRPPETQPSPWSAGSFKIQPDPR